MLSPQKNVSLFYTFVLNYFYITLPLHSAWISLTGVLRELRDLPSWSTSWLALLFSFPKSHSKNSCCSKVLRRANKISKWLNAQAVELLLIRELWLDWQKLHWLVTMTSRAHPKGNTQGNTHRQLHCLSESLWGLPISQGSLPCHHQCTQASTFLRWPQTTALCHTGTAGWVSSDFHLCYFCIGQPGRVCF